MAGKTNQRFDGIVWRMRDPLIRQKAGRFSALTSIVLILIALISNSVFPRTILGEAGSASANRLWSGGAELQSTTADVETDANDGSSFSISTSIKRSGAASWRVNGSNSAFNKYFVNTPTQGKFWARIYLYIATTPSAQIGILRYNGAAVRLGVRINTDNTLELWNEEDGAQIGSDSSALSTTTWYRIELYGDTTTLASTSVALRLNGVETASGTANLAAAFDRIQFGVLGSATTDLHFDDIAVNDATGRTVDNWPGEGKIVHMQPDADGDNVAWTGDPSNVNDFDDIDEVTPNSNTDFIYSQTQDQLDDVNLESATSAGLTAGDSIKVVSVGVRLIPCGIATGQPTCMVDGLDINYKTRLKASGGGTTDESVSTGILDSSGYVTNNDDTAGLSVLTIYDLPGSSTVPWTTTDLDSAQIGIRNDDANFIGFRVTTLWLLVEYVDRSGGRIYSGGFELQSASAGMEYTANIGTAPTVDTTNERSGAAALQTSASSATSGWEFDFASANVTNDYYFRAYIRVATAPGTLTNIMEFYDSANTVQGSIRMNTDRTLELWNDEDTAQVGSDSSAIAATTWTRLELRLNCSGTCAGAGSATLDARINGSSFASSSTINHANGVMTLRAGVLTSTTADFSWDDVALNQAVGATQNTWPGAGQIIHLRPSSDDATNTAWTNGFANVDEVTPNDVTDLVSETTSGDIDDYDIDNSSLGAADPVNLVSVGVRFNSVSATQEDFRVRLKDSTTGIAIESNTLSPASTTWITNATADPKLYPLTAYTRPEQLSVWLDAQLDTAQIGVRDVLSGTGTAQVTALWLLVDYTPPANSAPNTPTSLVQKKTTGGATLAVGDWTNETQVTFDATATDTDNPDTLQLCVEKDLLGTAFSNTEDSCGSGVAYSGTGVTVTVTISSQTDASEYHWQARVKDAASAYSSWVSYPISSPNAESARDYGIDTTACTYASSVYDGTIEDTDEAYNDGSLTSLSANWDAFTCTVSGLNKYQYSVGTTIGGTDIKTWTDNSTTESVTATGLVLRTNQKYYVNVRAVDNAVNTSSVTSSNGQDVLPTISMSLSAGSITFATLASSNDRSDSKTITTTASTNGYSGYVIRQYISALLTAGSFTIPQFSAGSYASPAAWPAGACSGTTCGYGYTSNDTTIGGANKFSSATLYAPFAIGAFGDIVADHTTNVDGSTGAVVNEQFIITHKVAVDTLQAAQSYTTTVYVIITGLF